jgi:phosphomannomutase
MSFAEVVELVAAAKAWIAQDPDAETRFELDTLVAKVEAGSRTDLNELRDRFGSRLGFGTAGLRGELGAGPNRMNRVLVAQAAAGIAAYLNANFAAPTVAIGFDGRVNSDVFASDSAAIFAAAGIQVHLFDAYAPTPLLAFAVKHLGLSAGVMVTASHNPPRDNGYKVYLGGANGGSQINSPVDGQIAFEIERVAKTLTFDQIAKVADLANASNVNLLGEDVRLAYRTATAKWAGAAVGLPESSAKQVKMVYTAMHGVGWATVEPLWALAGLQPLETVPEQLHPDGAFPTVSFPNPEEPGALDLAFAKARATGAEVILANDPDADRLAVAVADASAAGGWRRLTGDEVGLILADELAGRAAADGTTVGKGVLACSIVSSSALAKVAAAHGLDFVETLTGFKWISKVPNLIFGFEEALGYCIDPQQVPDKDGISAAVFMAGIVNRLAANGQTLDDRLAELGQKYGFFATGQISIRVTDLAIIGQTMARLRAEPPSEICGNMAVLTDLALGARGLPPTEGLRFDIDDQTNGTTRRVIVRPSGTEPKLKCYLQTEGSSAEEAQAGLAELTAAMKDLLA